MPIYVTNPLDRSVTLHADDGHTVQVPPKVRDAKVHAKFAGGIPSTCRVVDKRERSRAERLEGFGLDDAPAEASAPEVPNPPAPLSDDHSNGVEGVTPSGAGPP